MTLRTSLPLILVAVFKDAFIMASSLAYILEQSLSGTTSLFFRILFFFSCFDFGASFFGFSLHDQGAPSTI